MDVEIFIRDIEVAEAVGWLEGKLGRLARVDEDDGILYLQDGPGVIRAVVTPNMEDGPFLSVYVNGEMLPWKQSRQLAVACAQELSKTVRWCDETTNRWVEKRGSGPEVGIELDD